MGFTASVYVHKQSNLCCRGGGGRQGACAGLRVVLPKVEGVGGLAAEVEDLHALDLVLAAFDGRPGDLHLVRLDTQGPAEDAADLGDDAAAGALVLALGVVDVVGEAEGVQVGEEVVDGVVAEAALADGAHLREDGHVGAGHDQGGGAGKVELGEVAEEHGLEAGDLVGARGAGGGLAVGQAAGGAPA